MKLSRFDIVSEMSCITVLHVDDEPDFLDVATELLQQQSSNFNIITETSGTEALERLATSDVDCIVSDYRMPGQDGIELLEAVREKYPNLPFIG